MEYISKFKCSEIDSMLSEFKNSVKPQVGTLQLSVEGINAELSTINSNVENKQDKISDLDSIRSGAEKGATAIQEVKTINGESIVGEGNIVVRGGGASDVIIELNGDEVCDYFAINNKGEAVSASGYGCTSYIPCYGCVKMHFTNMQLTSSKTYGLAFYDESKAFISYVPSLTGSKNASVMQEVSVPNNAHYFKASFFNYETQKSVGDWKCTMVFNDESTYTKDGKRPYQDGYIFFSQQVDQSITKYWEASNSVQHNPVYKVTTGVVALPKTYKKKGKKTPLILYAHGLSQFVYYGTWSSTNSGLVQNLIDQKQRWIDMGFAVMDCNGPRDNNKLANFATGVCPQGVNAYKQCVDYIVKHYNIDSDIYVVGSSAGGAIAWNFINMYGKSVKAAAFLSAWSNFHNDGWTNASAMRNVYVEFLGFNNTSTYEADKALGFDQARRIVTINNTPYCFTPNIPLYAVYGSTETAGFITSLKSMFTALRNAGMTAQIREVNGVGHEISYGGVDYSDIEVGYWFLSHQSKVDSSQEFCTITYNYVDTEGNVIAEPTSEKVVKGTSMNFSKATLDGYVFVSSSASSVVVNKDMTVTYTFRTFVEVDVTNLFKWTNGAAIETYAGGGNGGGTFATSLFKYCDYVDVSEMPDFSMSFVKWKSGAGKQATLGYALYDANKNYVSGYQFPLAESASNSSGIPYVVTVNITDPKVKYIRTCYPVDETKYGVFKATKLG